MPSLARPSTSRIALSDNASLLDRQRARESNARTYPRRIPIAVARARGTTVVDADGRHYLDALAGAGALALGHNHPAVVGAVEETLRSEAAWTTLDLPTPIKDRFVDDLFEVLPDHLRDGRIQFCGPTGADAVEAALKLVRHATGRTGTIAFGGSYHGMTSGALSVTGARSAKEHLGTLVPGVTFLPFPDAHRPVLGDDADDDVARCAGLLEWTLADDHSGTPTPASAIFEPVQGEGGINPMPSAFAAELRRSTARHGLALIADEVQTGLGRTGRLWGSDHLDIEPDVLVLSKAIGGGLPLAVIVYREELDSWEPGMHAGTFRGNQLAMAAGSATIREVAAEHLDEHAARMGERLLGNLGAAAATSALVGAVRGRGLMVGAEITGDDGEPDEPRAAAVQTAMLDRGVIVECGGRDGSVVRFLPPLIITAAEIDQIGEVFADAVTAVEGSGTGSRTP